jgi:hypothetical protein
MGGTKKGACKDWKNFCFRQLCVDSDRLCTDSYNIKMHVSGYQSIDMHCIVLPVKFDGRLAISVLRNEQLFTKNWRLKTDQFQKAPIFKPFKPRHLEKVPFFLDSLFLVNGIDNPPSI